MDGPDDDVEAAALADGGSDAADAGPKTRTVFVTSTTWTGNLGGVAGADAKCAAAAADAGLVGSFLAWISTTSTTPKLRFMASEVPYALVDGTLVAADWNHLTGGISLLHAIDRDEYGSLVGFDASADYGEVWTSTLPDGTSALADFPNGCADFASDDPNTTSALLGCTNATDAKWTQCGSTSCQVHAALYCFQQSP